VIYSTQNAAVFRCFTIFLRIPFNSGGGSESGEDVRFRLERVLANYARALWVSAPICRIWAAP
jgi:hypothetical protein